MSPVSGGTRYWSHQGAALRTRTRPVLRRAGVKRRPRCHPHDRHNHPSSSGTGAAIPSRPDRRTEQQIAKYAGRASLIGTLVQSISEIVESYVEQLADAAGCGVIAVDIATESDAASTISRDRRSPRSRIKEDESDGAAHRIRLRHFRLRSEFRGREPEPLGRPRKRSRRSRILGRYRGLSLARPLDHHVNRRHLG